MKRFAVMLAFWTRIPVKIRGEITYDDYVSGVFWTPFIALMIGVVLYFAGYLSLFIHPYICSVIILFLYLFVSGGLHIDGLADTFDAFGSNRSRQRMLEILKDSHIGTFGVLAVVMYCIVMVVLLPFIPPFGLLLFPLVGRTTALLSAKTHVYARETGIGKSFVEGAKAWHIILSFILYTGIAYLVIGKINTVSVLTALLPPLISISAVWGIVHGMSKKIGGITGDLIGFSIEVSSLLYLFLTYAAVVIITRVV